jgi:nucleotide-binding universal stress UspA family protein
MFKNILVPTDGSKLSSDMADHALRLAKDLGAQVTFFFATTETVAEFYGGEGTIIDQASPEILAEEAAKQSHRVLSQLVERARAAGVTCSSVTATSDHPFQAIIDAATERNCDLIFMASHGRRGIKALILGSETQRVLTHSKIPVLVYR